ncbi:hypothetical protein Btru_022783 [Bulinus truncatus]|nr:hypothetical protein Btru_022783 [Bulinus truncatus]
MIESSRVNRTIFVPSTSFYSSKAKIENTVLYQLINKMPKGAALHIHDQSMVSLDWIIKNVTYRDDVYMCLWEQSYLIFRVLNKSQSPQGDCEWKQVTKERGKSKNIHDFDLNIRNNLSLLAGDPFLTFPDNQAAWVKFSNYFTQVDQLLHYIPIFRDMLWQTMMEFREANVHYIEVRVYFNGLFDLNGTVYNREYCVLLVKEVSESFVKQYPDFMGMKVIFSGSRFQNVSVVLDEVKDVMMLHKKYPEVVSGYEALYNPLSYYSEALLYPSQQDPPYNLPYFLHAGETNLQGTETGYNVVDALLLNSTRVGHAYALSKHPHLMKLYKERDIPLEVQPLSNQVLRLVDDLRNHPMASLIADNYSIVISCDDRTTMDLAPLSHDFYIVFTAMSSDRADLTLLKQLAINSIRFSSLTDVQKQRAMTQWQTKWDKFILEVPNDKFTTITPPVTGSTSPPRNNAPTSHGWTHWWQYRLVLDSLVLSISLLYLLPVS